jgi:hypothetical protein
MTLTPMRPNDPPHLTRRFECQTANPAFSLCNVIASASEAIQLKLSFRGDAKHLTMVRNCAPENLEIPGSPRCTRAPE